MVVSRVAAAPAPQQSAGPGAGAGAGLSAPQFAANLRPAFTVPTPHALARSAYTAEWAPVRAAASVWTQPGRGRVVSQLPTRTPEATTNIVLVLGRAVTPQGQLWIRVSLAVLPNGTTGWVPRSALGGEGVVDTHLIIDRHNLTATLLRGGRPIFRAPVGIGEAATPTPAGQSYIRDELTRYSSPAYGPLAFGTSDRSATLTDWPAGGYIGIHGTDQPELLPGRVSHGCIRMRNADILRLGGLMPVGTPITIR